MNLSFIIWETPVAKGRPRFYNRGKFIGTYTPTKTRSFENLVATEAIRYKPVNP